MDDLERIATQVNLHNLDQVLVEHSQLFERYTRGLPDARKKHAEAKDQLARIQAEIQLKKRDGSIKPPTIAVMEAMVKVDPDYIQAQQELINAKHELDRIENAKEFFILRDSNLKSLVHLFGAQYWALDHNTTSNHGSRFSPESVQAAKEAATSTEQVSISIPSRKVPVVDMDAMEEVQLGATPRRRFTRRNEDRG